MTSLYFSDWILPVTSKLNFLCKIGAPLMACTRWRNFWWTQLHRSNLRPFGFKTSLTLPPPQRNSTPPSKAACKKSEGPGWRHCWDRWRTLETTAAAQFAPLVHLLPPSLLQATGYCRCNRFWSCPLLPPASWRRREGWWNWSTSSLLWPPRGSLAHLGSLHSHTRGLSLTAWWEKIALIVLMI